MAVGIPAHAIRRWQERVSNVGFDEARQEMERFLAAASIEGKPRSWMKGAEQRAQRLARHGAQVHPDPVAYAYNVSFPGVCIVLAMATSPFILTVATRAMQRERNRRYQQTMATESRHRRQAFQFRAERRRMDEEAS